MTRVTVLLAVLLVALVPQEKRKSYRLPPTDLKQRVLWGSTCEVPDGPSLAFGGQDQQAEDGNPHTRVKVDGQWTAIMDELRAGNPLQRFHAECVGLRNLYKEIQARERSAFLEDAVSEEAGLLRRAAALRLETLRKDLTDARMPDEDLDRSRRALERLKPSPIDLDLSSELLDAEPPPRALSPIAYDAKTRLFVLFGGDHLDYLTNDTWVFDPARKKWHLRHPAEAPPPRANHVLKAAGDGGILLSGGYTYTSSTDYCGGQYRDVGDGDWTYDVAENRWTGPGKGTVPAAREYRTGRLHPDFYLQGPKPDRAEFALRLAQVPANTWTKTNPPHLPALNRDWGTAVLDADRGLILRWSGGHSAHGGTDVLRFHLATNRWELTHPVEFPLGQLYSNTEYPEGVNFNRRPWITGHTYQNYGYDPNLKKMLFTGRHQQCHIYDPDIGDWVGRFAKPKGMTYGGSFYTLTITSTPRGLVCWTRDGLLFRFDGTRWVELTLTGAKLPGSVVDNSTVVHDVRRDRLLFARKPYGDKTEYDGMLHAVDLRTLEVTALAPEGKERAGAIPYLCQFRYDPASDLVLGGCTLPPDADGVRRTPAYDPAGNRWVSLKILGDDPSGRKGRNVSLGLMVDARRKLFWAVDTNSQVYVLRLDVGSADPKPL